MADNQEEVNIPTENGGLKSRGNRIAVEIPQALLGQRINCIVSDTLRARSVSDYTT